MELFIFVKMDLLLYNLQCLNCHKILSPMDNLYKKCLSQLWYYTAFNGEITQLELGVYGELYCNYYEAHSDRVWWFLLSFR